MHIRLTGVGLAAVLTFVPGAVHGQATLGPTLAYHDDADFGIGATLGIDASSLGAGVGFVGDFIVFFPEGAVDYLEFNANLTYDFPLQQSTVVPFALAGLNIARASLGDVSNTEVGLNLGGGVEFSAGRFRPTAGLRVEIEGGDAFVFFISLPFALGG
jgi:hypothetical protein